MSIGARAQVGIDLTEMVNAPDSGYMILTTGDEYPDRGLQKYVPFDSLIPLQSFRIDTATSEACFRFAHDTAEVCYPIVLPEGGGGSNQNLSILRDGDTIRLSISSGNEVAWKDSTRSDQDVAQVARDSFRLPLIPEQIVFGGADSSHAQDAELNYQDGAVQIGTTDKTGDALSIKARPVLSRGQDTAIIHIDGLSQGSNSGLGQTTSGIKMDYIGDRSNSIFKGLEMNYENTTGVQNYAIMIDAFQKLTGGASNPRAFVLDTEITNGLSTNRNYRGFRHNLYLPNAPGDAGNQDFIGIAADMTADDLVNTRKPYTANMTNYRSRMTFNKADSALIAKGLDIDFRGSGASIMPLIYGVYQRDAFAKNYFEGNTGFGTNMPERKVDIAGDASLAGKLYDVTNSDGVALSNPVLTTSGAGVTWVEGFSGSYQDLTGKVEISYDSTLNAIITCVGDAWLEFDGVDDYVQARNTSDLNFALPIKMRFKHKTSSTYSMFTKTEYAGSPNRYFPIIESSGDFGMYLTDNSNTSTDLRVPATLSIGEVYDYELFEDNGDIVQTLNGVEISRNSQYVTPSPSPYYFFLAAYPRSGQTTFYQFAEVDIYSFQIGTETFAMNEGSGATITGSEGTVLDIHGTTWHSTCTPIDTIFLNDIHTDSLFRQNDSLFVRLNDGQAFGVPDATVDLMGIRDSIQQNTTDITNHIAADNDLDPTNELQDLTRTGDEIGLTNSAVTTIDRNVTAVDHLGDSVRFTMSDGRTFVVRDSAVSKSKIDDWIQDGIPDTVFYTKIDDVTAPVKWGDVVEIEGGTINVNKPAEITWDSAGQVLTICQFAIDSTVTESYNTYLDFHNVAGELESRSSTAVGWSWPMKIKYSTTDNTGGYLFRSFKDSYNSWRTSVDYAGYFLFAGQYKHSRTSYSASNYDIHDVDMYQDGNGDFVVKIDGYERHRASSYTTPSGAPYDKVTVGRKVGGSRFKGNIYSFQIGTETFDVDEGSGTTVTGSNGTIFDIDGGEWVTDTSSIVDSDTITMCDTINLSADTYLDTAYYVGDSLYLTLNSGKTFAVEVISGATQVLSHDTTTLTTTLSEGGGQFSMEGKNNIEVKLDTFGHYTISADTLYAEDGKSLEFDWNGTQLGVRKEGDPTYQYVDLEGPQGQQGIQGIQGVQGNSIEYQWNGTELCVRIEGQQNYSCVDLKGEKGDQGVPGPRGFDGIQGPVGPKGDPPDTLMYIDDGQLVYAVQAGDTIEIDSATLILADSTGLAYLADSNQLVYSQYEDNDWVHDTIQLNDDVSIYTHDGEINDQTRTVDVKNNRLEFVVDSGQIKLGKWGAGFDLWGADRRARLRMSSADTKTVNTLDFRQGVMSVQAYHTKPDNSLVSSTFIVDTGGIVIKPERTIEGVFDHGDKRRFLRSYEKDVGSPVIKPYVVWDTVKIEDIGITTADTARWGEGGAPQTLSRSGDNLTLSDGGGTVSVADGDSDDTNELDIMQGFTSSDLVRFVPSYNELRILGQNGISVSSAQTYGSVDRFTWTLDGSNAGKDYTITRSGTGIRLLENSGYNSQVNLSGSGGISLSGSGSTINIDASGAGKTYALSKSTEPALIFKEDGLKIADIAFVGTGGIQVNDGFGQIEIDGSGIGSKWTSTGSNIYRNSGVSIGGAGTESGKLRTYYPISFYNGASEAGVLEWNTSISKFQLVGGNVQVLGAASLVLKSIQGDTDVSSGYNVSSIAGRKNTVKSGSGYDVEITSGDDILLKADAVDMTGADDIVYKSEQISGGNTRYTITAITSTSAVGMTGAPTGTIRYVINKSGSSITVAGQSIANNKAQGYIRHSNTWFPIQ